MLRRFVAERGAFISVIVFGLCAMLADFCADMNWRFFAALLRFVGIVILIVLLVYEIKRRSRPLATPLVFTTESSREVARQMFVRFVASQRLSVKPIETIHRLQASDLVISLHRNPYNSPNPADWEEAWRDLLKEWEKEVDQRLRSTLLPDEQVCYHIFPHLWLPLAFAMGASVDLRRSIVLYHRQEDRFYRVLDLTYPRRLFEAPNGSVSPPEKVPSDFATLPEAEKLILHWVISDYYIPQFDAHPDYASAANAGLVYRMALDPTTDWLPYVQWLFREAQPLVAKYQQVEVCLYCPAVIAFALGMAFSRTPKITVCDLQQAKYVPVFSLATIEQRLPFD